jgi:capsular polysaccharide transport system permease protein
MENILAKMRDAVRLRSESGSQVQDLRRAALNFSTYKYVLLVVGIATFYYVALASDRYVATAQVYVKQDNSIKALMPTVGLFGGGMNAGKDMQLVDAYVKSQDLLVVLDRDIQFSDHFSDRSWDFYSRMEEAPTEEDRLAYFQTRLTSGLDQDSGIITLKAQGYTQEYALTFLQHVIKNSEAFINGIGQQIATQEIEFVEGELARAKERLDEARTNLLKFQNEHGILSAKASGAALQSVVISMENELVQLRTEEKALSSYLNGNAAELVSVRARIEAIESQILAEREKLASDDGQSQNDVLAAYLVLEMEVKFTTDLYQASLVALEKARIESYKKLKHLVVVQSPQMPDEALEPRKFYNIATLFVVLSLAYGIISMIIATIREHRDV